jgi:hypothetical protein
MRPSPRLILLLFLLAQVCDGLFTYVAVGLFGIAAEGNVLLSTWMHVAGAGPTLLAAKGLALACGALLYVRGLHWMLGGLTAVYAFGAVGPWLLVFSHL